MYVGDDVYMQSGLIIIDKWYMAIMKIISISSSPPGKKYFKFRYLCKYIAHPPLLILLSFLEDEQNQFDQLHYQGPRSSNILQTITLPGTKKA